MTVKQLSVFIENRRGRLGEVLKVLKDNNVNILSMSLADTTEYGLLRLIVNNPEHGRDVLLDAGFSSMLTEVLIIKVPHVAGSLQRILTLIAENEIDIEYMYGLSVETTDASIVVKTNALDLACKVLKSSHIDTMTPEEIASL
ncbi:MAG: ACT domain-containing protein [Clostridia bacterium]|nr:ACT domain-containing protein [Clostridia bacterium]